MQTIIAIDPGTDKSGVACYFDGKLVELKTLTLPSLVEFTKEVDGVFVVEDVEANSFMYARNTHHKAAAQSKMAQGVGMVKGTARHILEFLAYQNKAIVKIAPRSGNWGTIKPAVGSRHLAATTGWTGKSNKDTRSAAYFGWVYLQQLKYQRRAEQ
ncbi:hypothetical protein [Reinekea sp.]|jgi:hypothetical protein|uniref:hypothetical protein n=1 Tax=Reinekea sp. TaxID=1970455 RepID=UPI003989B5DA